MLIAFYSGKIWFGYSNTRLISPFLMSVPQKRTKCSKNILLCLVHFSAGQTLTLKSETLSAQKVSVLSRVLLRFKQKTYILLTSSPAESQRDVIFHFKCYSLISIKIQNWNEVSKLESLATVSKFTKTFNVFSQIVIIYYYGWYVFLRDRR